VGLDHVLYQLLDDSLWLDVDMINMPASSGQLHARRQSTPVNIVVANTVGVALGENRNPRDLHIQKTVQRHVIMFKRCSEPFYLPVKATCVEVKPCST